MKTLYIICTLGKGVGGHYFSYKMTAEALSENKESTILINFQLRDSPIFDNMEGTKYKIDLNTINVYGNLQKLYTICKEHDIECVHAFGTVSYFYARLLNIFYNIPNVLTLCGGPSPKNYFPKANVFTVISREHIAFFNRNEKKFGIKHLYFIPNQVTSFETNVQKITELKNKYLMDEDKSILRISRISKFYEKSLMQSMDFIKKINEKIPDFKLLIVGQINDIEVYEKLKNYSGDNIFFETEKRYYENAKEIIGVSNFCMATGRSVMEAFSKGIPTFTPLSNRKIPTLVDENTFESCFFTNFSERNVVELNEEEIMNNFYMVAEDKDKLLDLKVFYNEKYKKYFDLENAKEQYNEAYQTAKTYNYNEDIIDLLKHFIRVNISIISHSTPLNKKNLKKIFYGEK